MIRVAPMRFLLSIVSPLHLAVLLAVAAGPGNSGAATLYGTSGTESTFGLQPYVAGDGALGRESLILFGNSTRGISETISVSDPDSAAMWIATMPESTDRDRVVGDLLWISLGSNPDSNVWRDALAWALAGSDNTEGFDFLDDDRRGRGRDGGNPDRDIALNWINSLDGDMGGGSSSAFTPIDTVPEPSVSLLGALAALGLLRRRR